MTARIIILCNFLLFYSCSFTQNEIDSKSVHPPAKSEKTSDFVNNGKLDTLSEMSSLFVRDTSLGKITIANTAYLKQALKLNLEYLQKKGSGSATPQRSLYYTYKDLRIINQLLQKTCSAEET